MIKAASARLLTSHAPTKEGRPMKISGNTVLITGGGSGIGRGLAEVLHARGNKVIIAGRRQSVLDETAAANTGMVSMMLNLESSDAIKSFSAELVAKYPDLNVLINNAGIMANENLLASPIDLAIVKSTIATNLMGPLRLTAALLPHLKNQPEAAIMMVSSGLAFLPLAMTPTYCATKAAIHSYAQSLRYQLKSTSVQVIELIPPYVQTELQGSRQASDPMAMPLMDFISETMAIIENMPDAKEICVERVKPLRFAEAKGEYDVFFEKFNDAIVASRH